MQQCPVKQLRFILVGDEIQMEYDDGENVSGNVCVVFWSTVYHRITLFLEDW